MHPPRLHAIPHRLATFAGVSALIATMAVPFAATASGQVASGSTTQVGHALSFFVSPPLRAIPPATAAGAPKEGPSPIVPSLTPHLGGPDPVVQHTLGPSAQALSVGANFDGVNMAQGGGWYPPDTNGAVGPNDYVQIVNTAYQVFDKTGKSLAGPSTIGSLWSGTKDTCANNEGDPVALYDRLANRWVLSQFYYSDSLQGATGECIAVSETSDPTGAYYLYDFQLASSGVADYPKLSVWPDGYYLTVNMFSGSDPDGVGATISHPDAPSEAFVFDRAQMLAGSSTPSFQTPGATATAGIWQLMPSDLDSFTPPPTGSPAYFVSDVNDAQANVLDVFGYHVDWTDPTKSTFTLLASPTVAGWNQLCPSTWRYTCISQPSTSQALESLGQGVMYRLAYRNFGDHESMVISRSVDAGSGVSGIRWYELRQSNGSGWSVYQQGTFSPDSTNRWMSSIAMDESGDIAAGYSVSDGTSTYPGIRVAARTPTDTLGQLSNETTIQSGSGAQTYAGRWGDYSAMEVDPSDDCTFWYTTEYMPASGSWQTRIASFKVPGCGGTTTSLATSQSPAAYGQQVTFTATVVSATGVGTPTGSVEFKDTTTGSDVCTSVSLQTVNGAQQAQCSTSSLSVTTHSIQATFIKNSYWSTSSGSTQEEVDKATSSTALASSANPSVYGQQVTFTATVSPEYSGAPTGTVTFTNGSQTLCSAVPLATVYSRQQASCTTSSLSGGSNSITATYGGDGNFTGSSASLVQAVNRAPTTAVLSSIPNPSYLYLPVTFTLTLKSVGSTSGATGTVRFTADGVTIRGCTAVSVVAGLATCRTSTLAVGVRNIGAAYSGDANYMASTAPTYKQTVKYPSGS